MSTITVVLTDQAYALRSRASLPQLKKNSDPRDSSKGVVGAAKTSPLSTLKKLEIP